jgi:hypothetical protein
VPVTGPYPKYVFRFALKFCIKNPSCHLKQNQIIDTGGIFIVAPTPPPPQKKAILKQHATSSNNPNRNDFYPAIFHTHHIQLCVLFHYLRFTDYVQNSACMRTLSVPTETSFPSSFRKMVTTSTRSLLYHLYRNKLKLFLPTLLLIFW